MSSSSREEPAPKEGSQPTSHPCEQELGALHHSKEKGPRCQDIGRAMASCARFSGSPIYVDPGTRA